MADRLLISTEEMRTAVSTYEEQKEIKMEALAQMKNAVDNMDGSWDGPASEIFMAAFNALYAKMLKTEELMDDAINELNNLIARTEEIEEGDAANIGHMAEGLADSI